MTDKLTEALARAVTDARIDKEWSVAQLAAASGVSRAMIAKVERAQAQPTAALLGRLSAALGLTLTDLVARAESGEGERLVRVDDQPHWTDPVSRYRRRAVSPPASPIQLVEVTLPAHAEVAYPAGTYTFVHQVIWVLDGRLRFVEGSAMHDLETGDCLSLGPPADCAFVNPTRRACHYLVAVTRR